MSDKELKPCPCCHGGAKIRDAGFLHWSGICEICGWQGPRKKDKFAAITAWNTRAEKGYGSIPGYVMEVRTLEAKVTELDKEIFKYNEELADAWSKNLQLQVKLKTAEEALGKIRARERSKDVGLTARYGSFQIADKALIQLKKDT